MDCFYPFFSNECIIDITTQCRRIWSRKNGSTSSSRPPKWIWEQKKGGRGEKTHSRKRSRNNLIRLQKHKHRGRPLQTIFIYTLKHKRERHAIFYYLYYNLRISRHTWHSGKKMSWAHQHFHAGPWNLLHLERKFYLCSNNALAKKQNLS